MTSTNDTQRSSASMRRESLPGGEPGVIYPYRFYSVTGQLLYVGLTTNLGQRLAQWNGSEKPSWWDEVDDIRWEKHPGSFFPEGVALEKKAIQEEQPKYNKTHRLPPKPGPVSPKKGQVVPNGIRRRRDRPERELPEIAGGAIRFTRKVGERIGEQGDPDDLRLLIEGMEDALRDAKRAAVTGLRRQGYSDQTIGESIGKYRQWVEYHFPRGEA